MMKYLAFWRRNKTPRVEAAPPWTAPVRLLVPLRIGLKRYPAGSRIELPFGKAVVMDRDGRAVLLLPSVDMVTGKITDPTAPRRQRVRDPREECEW
jgi:hypothetical protein